MESNNQRRSLRVQNAVIESENCQEYQEAAQPEKLSTGHDVRVRPMTLVRHDKQRSKTTESRWLDSCPKLVIPKPTSLRVIDPDLSEGTPRIPPVPEFSPKHFPRKREMRNHASNHCTSHENSSRYMKLESRSDDDMDENHRQVDDNAPTQRDKHPSTSIESDVGEPDIQIPKKCSEDNELSSSTCATWHSWFPSLLSHSSRAVDDAEVTVTRFHRKALRERKAGEKQWYERSESEKGKVVSDEPRLMHMIFFDREETGSRTLIKGCWNVSDEREGMTAVEITDHNISHSTHVNGLTIESVDSQTSPLKRDEKEAHSDLSPASDPNTLRSHSQSNELSNTNGSVYVLQLAYMHSR